MPEETCPFKYEADEYHERMEWQSWPLQKTGNKYMACDMRHAKECVGEGNCPIYRAGFVSVEFGDKPVDLGEYSKNIKRGE